LNSDVVPEVVRKAFKIAQSEKTGATFIEFPEDVASLPAVAKPLRVNQPFPPEPPQEQVERAARLISEARNPMILAGNGVVRAGAWKHLSDFAEQLNIPVANTFMAKGVAPFRNRTSLGSAGLQANDYISCGFSRADAIICVGYDLVEYHPYLWHPTRDRTIIHIDRTQAEVDEYYTVTVGVLGDLKHSLMRIAALTTPHQGHLMRPLRQALIEDMNRHSEDTGFPIKPQKIIWELRTALELDDIVVCDVGAHKMWMARMFRCEQPNTCIISNGFASMGIAVPGAVAAKMVFPDRAVVAVTGDAGFLMNSQEIETAVRLRLPIVILIWNDAGYGLIEWKQLHQFQRPSHVDFSNPDFVKYAESFGAAGYRVSGPGELQGILKKALMQPTVSIIDCPVDYSENLKLTEQLGNLVCPI
jgi:acetolactate synthase-1/2/3 large subunit